MTETQQEIYNLYLKAYRINNNSPFKPKKNFKDFEKHQDYFYVVKLDNFFKKFPHLLKLDFFNAPYKLYGEVSKKGVKFYGLKYFASYRGLTTCVDYYKSILHASPDEHIPFIKESLKFIAEFCVSKDIPLEEYCHYQSVAQNDFFLHLKEHRVSWFVIFGLKGALDSLFKMDPDEFYLFFGENINISAIQTKYHTSKLAKNVVDQGVKIIKNYIETKREKV